MTRNLTSRPEKRPEKRPKKRPGFRGRGFWRALGRGAITATLTAFALFAAPLARPAAASIITYDFSFTANPGDALGGTTASGSFSYDSAIVVPNSSVDATGLLSALNFTWDGITYTATTANTGLMKFDGAGNLTEAFFGTSCDAAQCTISPPGDSWSATLFTAFSKFGPDGYLGYSVPGDNSSYGTSQFTLAGPTVSGTTTVPEPATLALFLAGLLGLMLLLSRHRRPKFGARPCAATLAAFALFAAPLASPAAASTITYDFTFTATSGPLSGQSATGSFSYDSAIAGPYAYDFTDQFTAFNLTWHGITYTTASVSPALLQFDGYGNLAYALFGTGCASGGCGIPLSTEGFYGDVISSAVDPSYPHGFTYQIPGTGNGAGTTTLALAPNPPPATVPEPATLALFLTALVGLTGLVGLAGLGGLSSRHRWRPIRL